MCVVLQIISAWLTRHLPHKADDSHAKTVLLSLKSFYTLAGKGAAPWRGFVDHCAPISMHGAQFTFE